ncbi:MAG: dTDP-4-dehydrorhamnose 3,5-epimerase family protein [Candidatus Micrarchaeota archaeon]
MIHGVELKKLTAHRDARGFLFEILRGSDKIKADGQKFGQVYMSACYPSVIKGKHMHKQQTDHLTIVSGNGVIHLHDTRESSPTKGEKMAVDAGEKNLVLVKIPPEVWHSIENTGTQTILFLNYVTREYNSKEPDEFRSEFDLKDKRMPTEPNSVG